MAVLGRKAGWRAAAWGAVCATLPDLDVLVPYGDPVRDFTFHRSTSHSLLWLSLAALPLAWLAARLHRSSGARLRDWLALVWLALVSHPLLDSFTVYGTQLLLPFTDFPVGVGSIFIIDPLYTVPLLVGVLAAMAWRRRRPDLGMRWNACGLALSTVYLAWSVGAQAHVEGVVQRTLALSTISAGRVLVTPTPFNTLLWRVVVMDDHGYHEGYYSLLDRSGRVQFADHPSDASLLGGLRDDWTIERLAWFSKGFFAVSEVPAAAQAAVGSASSLAQMMGPVRTAAAATSSVDQRQRVVMTDLRMGQTPWFVFSFVVAARDGDRSVPVPSLQLPTVRPPTVTLNWLWQRIWNESAGAPPTA